MIDIKELRIGNYIELIFERELDRGNGIIEDVEVSKVVQFAGHDPFSGWVYINPEVGELAFSYSHDLEPIPITGEWLIKLGFEVKKSNYSAADIYLKSSVDFNFLIEDARSGFNWIAGLYDIESVHQLQNLYFALTGKELTIKE